jgi:hypothetical protein
MVFYNNKSRLEMRRGDKKDIFDQSHEDEPYSRGWKRLEKRVEVLEKLLEAQARQIDKLEGTVQKVDAAVGRVD